MKRKGLAHIRFVLVRVCATAAFLFYGNILLGRLFEWTPFGFPIWNFASTCAACLAALFAFVVLMEVLWGRNGSRVACVFCGAVPLLLVAEPFIAAAGLCDQQAEWTGAAVGLFALPAFVVLFRKAGTLVPGRLRRPAPADATKPALWALFLVCLLLPARNPRSGRCFLSACFSRRFRRRFWVWFSGRSTVWASTTPET